MESYVIDWISMIVRWIHVITGIAWIGASFYFIWLDNSLENPPQWKVDKGIKGDLWAVHGGGIYEVAKYHGAPEKMPETLHWFKWEAYSTWLSGMLLLGVIYYLGADAYLIDPRVAKLEPGVAVGAGLAIIFGSWFAYSLLCISPLAKNGWLLTGLLLLLGGALAYLLTSLFSGRGAYIHFGAVIGTIMVGNVFRVIMPGQRKLVAALETGSAVNPEWGAAAKLRSTHNTYLTLPLIFIMISNHYPMTYGHALNWAVLLAIVVITGLSRQYFVLRHQSVNRPVILWGSAIAALLLAVMLAPKQSFAPAVEAQNLTSAQVFEAQAIILRRCASCHAEETTDPDFAVAPGGVMLHTPELMVQWAQRIKARSVDSHDMPFLNRTGMTDDERELVGRWVIAGAPLK
ncbi:MAG: urate hydroxylase PuuD [Congregibacter sp.]